MYCFGLFSINNDSLTSVLKKAHNQLFVFQLISFGCKFAGKKATVNFIKTFGKIKDNNIRLVSTFSVLVDIIRHLEKLGFTGAF